MLLTLVDVPFVAPETVRAVAAAFAASNTLIVRPAIGGRHGHPVIFGRELFDELLRADPVKGAKSVVHGHAAEIVEIEPDGEGAFIDIDTPEDYERWIGPLP